MTGSSHPILPSSTSIPSAAAVMALVVEPMEKRVSGPTSPPAARSRTPYPWAKTSSPSFTTATARPTASQSATARAT